MLFAALILILLPLVSLASFFSPTGTLDEVWGRGVLISFKPDSFKKCCFSRSDFVQVFRTKSVFDAALDSYTVLNEHRKV